MKQLTILLIIIVCSLNVFSQRVTVKDLALSPRDLSAQQKVRQDKNGKACAMIKVDVVGIKDMKFAEAVGDVSFNLGEYEVYVPAGLKTLTYTSAGSRVSGKVNIPSYNVSIEERKTYLLQLETSSRLRSAIFTLEPSNATLIVNGQTLTLNDDGTASIDLPQGTYMYTAMADGYKTLSGDVTLTDDRISTKTDISLEEIVFPVTINCGTDSATLYIDDEDYGMPENGRKYWTVDLPNGNHTLRIVKPKYEELESEFDVANAPLTLNKPLEMIKLKTVTHDEERSHTKVNLRNCWYLTIGGDYFFDKDKNDGYPFDVKAQLSGIAHFGGAFAFAYGLEFGGEFIDNDYKKEYNDTTTGKKLGGYALEISIPLQVGFSVPFGKYNRNLLSVLAGGYGKFAWNNESSDSSSSSSSSSESTDYWDYGLRGTLRVDVGSFTIAGNIGTSLNGKGAFVGIDLGWKMY